jgi:bacterioferritin
MENNDNHTKPGYSYPAPYSEIKVLEKNNYYAEILMDDYSGIVSEMTAINQYLYHHFVISKEYEEIKMMVENISIIEMKHLEMLAETIIALGGNPIYRGSSSTEYKYWNGSFIEYGNNILEQLQSDLQSEYKAINNYRKDLNIINDPYIQMIINRIILDEEVHAKLFTEAINKIRV